MTVINEEGKPKFPANCFPTNLDITLDDKKLEKMFKKGKKMFKKMMKTKNSKGACPFKDIKKMFCGMKPKCQKKEMSFDEQIQEALKRSMETTQETEMSEDKEVNTPQEDEIKETKEEPVNAMPENPLNALLGNVLPMFAQNQGQV